MQPHPVAVSGVGNIIQWLYQGQAMQPHSVAVSRVGNII